MNFPPKMPSMGDIDHMLGSVMPHHGTGAEMHGKAMGAVHKGENMVTAQEKALKAKVGNKGDLGEAFAKQREAAMGSVAGLKGQAEGVAGEVKSKAQGAVGGLGGKLSQAEEKMSKRMGHGNPSEAFSKLAHEVQGNPLGNVAEAGGKGAAHAAHEASHVTQQVASAGKSALNKLKHLF